MSSFKVTSIETLVDLVVTTAVVDKTAPDPANPRIGWHTDIILTGAVDRLVVLKHNDPAAYAEIGRRVFAKVQDLPEIAVLAQLAIFRGERLLPIINPEREQFLVQMAEELLRAVSALPDSTRKMRCKSLLEYHIGVLSDARGRFDLAAEMQKRSAEEADRLGDRPGVAIARFLEALYWFKYELSGKTLEALKRFRFSVMEEAFARVVGATRGSTLEVQWAQGNCPYHMIQACVWLDQGSHEWENWVKTTLAASEKLGEAFKPGAEFVRAVDMARRGDPKADEVLNAIADSGDVNENRAGALLVLARRAMCAGKREEAEGIVSRMPEQGAQHVCAVARRIMASN